MRRAWLVMLLLGLASATGEAAQTGSATTPVDATRSLLNQAADSAVAALGKTDGFMGNPEVRIQLPGKLQKASKKLRKLGVSKQTDALQLAMNRAAEASVPEARTLLLDAIREMSISDAAGIMSGPQDAATRYFQGAMSEKLSGNLMPIVEKTMADVQLAKQYEEVAAKATSLGLVENSDVDLDGYITRKTLDGLFLMMAKEEAAIRKR